MKQLPHPTHSPPLKPYKVQTLPKFRVRIDRATCHTVGDVFTKVVISLICDVDN